ncbi:AAA family ATPase [Ruegeria sp. HKCCSP351]|uniref:AAA family ATPase n=1 Tax=Ruegeria sp. HKCCSP351 TaxID=2794832 RepID=UPI001AE2AAC6|nr:AAA family ATPase [Ruegeria sp. HKCCSP351]
MTVQRMNDPNDIWQRAFAERNWLIFAITEANPETGKTGKYPTLPNSVRYPHTKDAAAQFTQAEVQLQLGLPRPENLTSINGDKIIGFEIGYLSRPDSVLALADLDNCRDPATGAVLPWATEILNQTLTYAEASVSGTGVRVAMQRMQGDEQHSSKEANDCGFFADGGRAAVLTFKPLQGYNVQPAPAPALRDAILARRGPVAAGGDGATSEIEATVSPDLMAAMLNALPNYGPPNGSKNKRGLTYDDWIDVALAVCNSLGHAEGRIMFDAWSQKSEKYDAKETAKQWRTLKPDGRLTLGRVHYLVKQANGGTLPPEVARLMQERHNAPHLAIMPTAEAALANLQRTPVPQPLGLSGYKGKCSAAQFTDGYEPFDYLLDGVLQTGRVQALTGFTGHAKTTTALHLAIAVARGAQFCGHDTLQGSVYFLAGENHDNTRVQYLAACHAQEIDPAKLPIYWHEGPFNVQQDGWQIIADVAGIDDLRLIIGDTHQAFFQGDSDNDNMQMLEAARQWRPLTQQIPSRPTVIIPTHPSGKTADRQNLVPRGGGAFLNEIDGNLTTWKDPSDPFIRIHWQGKHRGPDFKPMTFELELYNDSKVADAKGRPLQVPVLTETTEGKVTDKEAAGRVAELRILTHLSVYPDSSYRKVAEATSISKSTVERRIKAMIADKRLKSLGTGVYQVTPKGDAFVQAIHIDDEDIGS